MLQVLPEGYEEVKETMYGEGTKRSKTKENDYYLEITSDTKNLTMGYYPITRLPCIHPPNKKFTTTYQYEIRKSSKKTCNFNQTNTKAFRIYKNKLSPTTYTFHLGDCLEKLKQTPDKSVNIVITSPPYNIGLKYHKYSDKKPRDQYLGWIRDIFVELKRILTDDGHIFLNMGYTNRDPWIAMEVALNLKDILILQNNITWVKSISVPSEKDKTSVVTHGHFKPINSKRYINVTNENIYHFTKTDDILIDRLSVGVPYKWKCNLKNRKTGKIKPDIRCKGNTWFIPYETIQNKKEKGYHPATFPEGLVEHCIRISGIKKGTVLDPFIGSGTTVRVAKKLTDTNEDYSLSGIGIDVDETYIEYCNETLHV